MHCLGAVSGSEAASPSGVPSRGGVMSVVRSLGVLVCEGRIRGLPRGYKEGPHCAAPLQPMPNDHGCDKDNYLCSRYLMLVREIAERMSIGTTLSVEVLMCTDCPCGLARTTCKAPVTIIPTAAISPWQHSTDMLLEYWSIGIVASKSPEMMNAQGLYQAVRSRLHFSQLAAWWSRSNGTKPSYVTTRIVSHSDDNMRKFRETPIEHTFPLAGIGDGNSIKVTVWALPRLEEVPTLHCPIHPIMETKEDCAASRSLTPTKNGPLPSTATPESLVLPVLVDDRLQTVCDKPGKHHCHCEDEEGSPPSPSIRQNGERKRRRSLPCGPSPDATPGSGALPSVCETIVNSSAEPLTSLGSIIPIYNGHRYPLEDLNGARNGQRCSVDNWENHNYLGNGTLERCFRRQVSLEEIEDGEKEEREEEDLEENGEKRYKASSDVCSLGNDRNPRRSAEDVFSNHSSLENTETGRKKVEKEPKQPETGLNWALMLAGTRKLRSRSSKNRCEATIRANPMLEKFFNPEDSPAGSQKPYSLENSSVTRKSPTSACIVHQKYPRNPKSSSVTGSAGKEANIDFPRDPRDPRREITVLMSKLSFPKEKPPSEKKCQVQTGILDWFGKVPGRVLPVNSPETTDRGNSENPEDPRKNDVKLANCNLELSQREFNEVLAVLRSRTPSGRRRASVNKTMRSRRDRTEKFEDNWKKGSSESPAGFCPVHRESTWESRTIVCPCRTNQRNSRDSTLNDLEAEKSEILGAPSNKAEVLLGAILRSSEDRKGLSDISNGTRPRGIAENQKILGKHEPEAKIPALEDDKSLPSVLNKRLNRLKQLFKKEWEKTSPNETSPVPEARIPSLTLKNRVKRKIDFATLSVESQLPYEQFVNESISGIHQNPSNNSTNKAHSLREASSDDLGTFPSETATSNDLREETAAREKFFSHGNSSCSSAKSNATPIVCLQNSCPPSRSRKGHEAQIPPGEPIHCDDDETVEKGVPSAIEQEQFRRSLENAASMVFHSRTGLPLTSSPAPLRRGHYCFDYDSTLNSVSSKRSALFELNTPPSPGAVSLEETDREIEASGEGEETPKRTLTSRIRPQSHALLGSFEESALNGRLEPVSTVHGFTAELGASGSFCPKHRKLPVTVFFYTLGDNDKVSTPYLAHINLGKKGYQVPRRGTIQVTLLNPLGTVVKMFVVLYDLEDMPPRSHTFLRQRILRDKTLRYLVHLRFMSGKSGRVYLHTDIRMIICRKSDVDTASDFGSEPPKELRSYTHGPTNPKFSPRC